MHRNVLQLLAKAVAAVGLVLFLTAAVPQTAEAQGTCANCQSCFHCAGGLDWGVENCDMGGPNPQCPCRNLGSACNPELGLGTELESGDSQQFTDKLGITKYVLRLAGSVFGQFDCVTGDLLAVYERVAKNRFNELGENALAAFRERIHLSNYLDVTRVHSST